MLTTRAFTEYPVVVEITIVNDMTLRPPVAGTTYTRRLVVVRWLCVGWVFSAKEEISLRLWDSVRVVGCTLTADVLQNFQLVLINSNPYK